MKIGIDARMYGASFTGIGRYNAELIKHLAKLDDKNDYWIFLRKDEFEAFTPPSERFHKVLADFPHYTLAEQIGFLRLLNSLKLDLMHFTHFNAPVLYRRPFVVTIHDMTLSFFPGKKMTDWLHRLAYRFTIRRVTRRAKRIIAISKNTQNDLVHRLGLPTSKIDVIYNGVTDQFEGIIPTPRPELQQKLGINKPYFLYTGVWRTHKNVVGLIKAFVSFNKSVGGQYNLVITGKLNPTYHEVPDTVKSLAVQDAVHLAGLVSEADLVALYVNALAYVFPSFYEGFGLPPLEAMLYGTPVLASNQSAIPEICGEGNALYFNPYDLKDMQEKLSLMAQDASLRQTFRDRGLEHVKAFDWAVTAQKVLQVYQSALHHG